MPTDEIVRVRMSYDEFLALSDDDVRTEWVDGEVLFMPPVTPSHGFVVGRLTVALARQLTAIRLGPEIGVALPRNRVRAPDLLMAPDRSVETSGPWLAGTPEILLVVEVLSHSTRGEDLMRKPAEYAAARLQRYWILDVAARVLDAYVLRDGEWQTEASLDDAHPTAQFDFGEHGLVDLDIDSILASR